MPMWSIHFGSESGDELHAQLVLPFDRIVSFSMTTVQTGNPFHSGADPVVLYLLRRELQSVGRGRSTLRSQPHDCYHHPLPNCAKFELPVDRR
jgi:hypothetical protein